ncbi:MAG: TrkA family potassium uptake protein [Muribaculaceae bacterium]|nr:TrkA family potassium uptake protein [Muribaculaceae bacterium]
MRYLVIGLGIYGMNLATDLTRLGHEVIGADINPSNIEAVKDYISTAYQLDSTDEAALSVLPLKNVDLVIVAIGENFGASVKTVALLKKMKVPHIYARAIDELHEAILEGFNVDRILTPEQHAARNLSNEMELDTAVTSMRVTEDHYILKFRMPEFYIGTKYSELTITREFNLSIIAICRNEKHMNLMGIEQPKPVVFDYKAPDARVCKDDTIVLYGSLKDYKRFYEHIN